MERENFVITYEGGQVIKHKWNSSVREIETIVRQIAIDEGVLYHLVDSESVKGACGFGFVHGHRTWQSTTGKVLRFDIRKT